MNRTGTRLRAGRSGVETRYRQEFFFLQNVQTGRGTHPDSYSMGTGVISQGQERWGVPLMNHLHLASRIRISVVIHLLPLYTVMATLPLLSHYLTALSLTQTRGVQWLDESEQRTEQEVCAAAP